MGAVQAKSRKLKKISGTELEAEKGGQGQVCGSRRPFLTHVWKGQVRLKVNPLDIDQKPSLLSWLRSGLTLDPPLVDLAKVNKSLKMKLLTQTERSEFAEWSSRGVVNIYSHVKRK